MRRRERKATDERKNIKELRDGGGNNFHVWGPSKNVNSELRWEKGHNQNIGLDFSLFKHKVTGSFNYFHRKQSDLLGSYSVSVPPNLFSTIYANVGTLRNTGFELDITVNAVRTKDFTYSFTLVGATNNKEFETSLILWFNLSLKLEKNKI